jgi:hypothetical protein
MHYQIYTGFKRGVKVLGIFNVCARPQATGSPRDISTTRAGFACDEKVAAAKIHRVILARSLRANLLDI